MDIDDAAGLLFDAGGYFSCEGSLAPRDTTIADAMSALSRHRFNRHASPRGAIYHGRACPASRLHYFLFCAIRRHATHAVKFAT